MNIESTGTGQNNDAKERFQLTRLNTHLNNLNDLLIDRRLRLVNFNESIKYILIFIVPACVVVFILWAAPQLLHQLAFASLLRPSTVTSRIFENHFPANISSGVLCSGSPCTINSQTLKSLKKPNGSYTYVTIFDDEAQIAQLSLFGKELKKHTSYPLMCLTHNETLVSIIQPHCNTVKVVKKSKISHHKNFNNDMAQNAYTKLDLFKITYDMGFHGFTFLDYNALLSGSLDSLFTLIKSDTMKHTIYTSSLDSKYGNAFLTMSDFNVFVAASTPFDMKVIFERWFTDINNLPGSVPIRENNIHDYLSTFFGLYLSTAYLPPSYIGKDELDYETEPIYYHIPELKKIMPINCNGKEQYSQTKLICRWKSAYINELDLLKV